MWENVPDDIKSQIKMEHRFEKMIGSFLGIPATSGLAIGLVAGLAKS